MKLPLSLIGAAVLAQANPYAVDRSQPPKQDLLPRAEPNAPSGYAPATVSCPAARPTVRGAGHLSTQEQQWLPVRRNTTIDPMIDLLNRMNFPDFHPADYINSNRNNASALPNIGIAASGGGYRALLNGAGALAAFDSRTTNSTNPGQLGGLLQSTTYLAGLSGGGWLVGSLFANNFTSVQSILDNQEGGVWDFSNSIFQGPDGIPGLSSIEYYTQIQNTVSGKELAPFDFNVSITDYWGRALSYQLVDENEGGPNYTFSSIALQDYLTNGSVPLPLLVADERDPGTITISSNTTVFEFNPWEFGSWDPTLYGFAPLQYAGSNFSAGTLPDDQACVAGFDNIGYVMGTSSTLFNQFFLEFNTSAGNSVPQFIKDAVNKLLSAVTEDQNDIADWTPNPFSGFNPSSNPNANATSLTLVDGGEDLQNIPLHPLIQPQRELDVIFAIDSSADTTSNYPNGTAMVATYQRASSQIENGTAFPHIPDVQSFVNLGLNTKPTFFGCDPTNYTGPQTIWPGPLIVYLPNTYYVTDSGVATFDPSYNRTQRNAIIENGYDVATMANSTLDAQWDQCVGCAMLQRSMLRTGTPIPNSCNTCFQRYCWNGKTNTTANNFTATPKLTTINLSGGAGSLVPPAWMGIMVMVGLVSWLVGV